MFYENGACGYYGTFQLWVHWYGVPLYPLCYFFTCFIHFQVEMPRVRKCAERLVGKTSSESMENAIKRLEEGCSLRFVSREFNIPLTTLRRYSLKINRKTSDERTNVKFCPNYEVNKIFSKEIEKDLKDYIIFASKIHHGLTKKQTKLLAYQLALKNNLKMPPSWSTNRIAGEDWLKGFRNRWPEISIRKPEATSLARCTSFNKTTVTKFFDNVSRVYAKFQEKELNGNMIYNLDETALTTVHNPPNVLAMKGLKQVGQITSGERGVLVTACCCINAAGNTVPPFMVFPRVNFKTHMLLGSPPGTSGSASKSGWMNSEIFMQVLRHFTKHTKCSKENPVILFMDSHESHIQIEALDYCRQNGITIVTFPPHTTNKLQPLDRSVFKSLKVNYNATCNDWMLSNPGKTISIYEVSTLFGKSYPRAISPENIINGFKCTGIWPLDCNVFNDDDYLSSYVTDRPVPHQATSREDKRAITGLSPQQAISQLPEYQSISTDLSPLPSTSKEFSPLSSTSGQHSESTNIRKGEIIQEKLSKKTIAPNISSRHIEIPNVDEDNYFSPYMIRPFPKAEERKTKENKRRKCSEILTDTPVFNRILEDKQEKDAKEIEKKRNQTARAKRKIVDDEKNYENEKMKKRKNTTTLENIFDDSESEDDFEAYEESEFSIGSENFSDVEFLSPNSLKCGDFVVVIENKKSMKTYSIGEITEIMEHEIELNYYQRNKPYLKFSKTEDRYIYDKQDIERVLPKPLKCGGTKRTKATFSFPINLDNYVLGLQ